MKLTDLHPRWIEKDGQRIAIIFFCPHCILEAKARAEPLSCFFVSPEFVASDWDDGQYGLFERHLPTFGPEYAGYEANDVVPCKRGYNWTRTGNDFETLSVTPSLDASASGHWHGHITNGEIK